MKRILFFFLVLMPLMAWAQSPTVDPSATYYLTNEEGEEETDVIAPDTKPLSAPVRIVFKANLSEPCNVLYTWTITNTKTNTGGNASEPILRRGSQYGEFEELEMDFNESGSYAVQLNARFYDEEGENILYEFPEEGEDPKTIRFSISESKLEFPNGISPGCSIGQNDELKPKEGFKGIVEFHAAIFNRWGKKLYSWDDIHGGWDGKVNGKVVKDGVYFLRVTAKGSDGIDYNIKKAINVITSYNNAESEGTTEGE